MYMNVTFKQKIQTNFDQGSNWDVWTSVRVFMLVIVCVRVPVTLALHHRQWGILW